MITSSQINSNFINNKQQKLVHSLNVFDNLTKEMTV